MLHAIYNLRLDQLCFVALSALAAVVTHVALRRRVGATGGLGLWAWLAAGGIVAGTLPVSDFAARYEFTRLQKMISGLAPTYALELDRMGLQSIKTSTPADDPTYLRLIEAQKRWLAANPSVADIYTFARNDSGQTVLLVDSETDYDHNGAYDGDREARTPIGEVYEESHESIAKAFDGMALFDSHPTTDRWGTWVSTYVPIRRADGTVYGVLGVDYDASDWLGGLLFSRAATMVTSLVLVAILLSTAAHLSLMRAEVHRRRQAEEALRASEFRLRMIVDNEPECVMVVDRNGLVLEMNPAGLAMVQGRAQDVIGQPVERFIHPDHRQRFVEHHRSACMGERAVIEFELIGLCGGHTKLWMETHSVPLRDPAGKVVSVLSVARDVTHRKHAEAERERLQQQVVEASRFAGMAEVASGVLHNVGNVLNSVNVAATVCAERIKQSRAGQLGQVVSMMNEHRDDLADFLTRDARGSQLPVYLEKLSQSLQRDQETLLSEVKQVSDGLEHIKEIIRTQQSYARTSTVRQPVKPAEIFEDALRVNVVSLQRHEIAVIRQYEDIPELLLDKHKILQILVNLISNAKRAVIDGGSDPKSITLRLRRDGAASMVEFEVIDTGIGIPAENLSRIFQHGFTTRPDGHGFGLHSSANAATEMGGTLTGSSEGPGRGARFLLRLPMAGVPARTEAA